MATGASKSLFASKPRHRAKIKAHLMNGLRANIPDDTNGWSNVGLLKIPWLSQAEHAEIENGGYIFEDKLSDSESGRRTSGGEAPENASQDSSKVRVPKNAAVEAEAFGGEGRALRDQSVSFKRHYSSKNVFELLGSPVVVKPAKPYWAQSP